ncbi:ankyrin repeat domain-containing protein [Laceyella putida]|uniref:Ankyrin repeat domain-containing protein n=1 Tax=Laceyella putida TaxID=110101 RepID=A0ABW2RJD8_9BACL
MLERDKVNLSLILAAEQGAVETVRQLLDAGADVNAVDGQGETALHKAAVQGDLAMIQCLVEAGADVNRQNQRGETAIHKAFSTYQVPLGVAQEILSHLLRHGADPMLADQEGRTLLHQNLGAGAPKVVEQLSDYPSLLCMRDGHGRLPQHCSQNEASFRYLAERSGYVERSLVSSQGMELGEWCEEMQAPSHLTYFAPAVVRLHPLNDELLVGHPDGKISRWCYGPDLSFAEGIQTDQCFIQDLAVAPEGDWFAVVAPNLWGIEIRSMRGLRRIDLLRNEYTMEPEWMNALCISPDGKWIITDVNDDGYEGVGWGDRETNAFHFRSWKELGYEDPDYGYGTAVQLVLSPDQKRLALNELHGSSTLVHVFPGILAEHERKGSQDEWLLSQQAWAEMGTYISDLRFHPDSSRLIFFKSPSNNQHRPGWVGDLVAIAATHKEELWRVSIDAILAGSETELFENAFHRRYAGKVFVGQEEVVCTAPGGLLLFFDVETGAFKRKLKVNGQHILAIGRHRDGGKIRVATERELQVIEWK